MRALLLSLLLPALALAQGKRVRDGDDEGPAEVPHRLSAPPLGQAQPIDPQRDLLALAALGADGKLQVPVAGVAHRLTIDVPLQRKLEELLRTYQVPWGAVVALDPATGKVLAMAEHSEERPELNGLCTRALFPAASVFKVVTSAALLEAGVDPRATECIHGGLRKLTPELLQPSSRDTQCLTLGEAMGRSANVVFARLTARHLDAGDLERTARALHFNTPWHFPVPTEVSLAAFPQETFELASTGAGFGDVFLSPLHGAALAAAFANHGQWRDPQLLDDEPGPAPTQVVTPEIAAQVADMLQLTVTSGTARRVFHERGNALPDAAGKTGSLADQRPFRDYSLFVGYAPREAPRIAVGVVVVNDPHWRIRATWLGREAMRLFLAQKAPQARRAPPDARGGDGGVPLSPAAPSPRR